ncbi:hypothetical protein ScalyP_jg6143 [Parmales sp. scaly parma]|nr:hypothetical protein ScalyP_jg6143 [Parmales sp. scaly parma]
MSPSCGYATQAARIDFLRIQGLPQNVAKLVANDLQAATDLTEPLYFWQLYSIIGDEGIITRIITSFYQNVYNDDDDPEFRQAFARISGIEHHIETQTQYWIDAFGGGPNYHGGEYRLNFHHSHNAEKVMNAAGAKRWMYHMSNALSSFELELRLIDPRVFSCIVSFLCTKMKVYAEDNNWKFSEIDFKFAHSVEQNTKINQLTNQIQSKLIFEPNELDSMSIKKLNAVAKKLNIDTSNAVEKSELVTCISDSEKISVASSVAATSMPMSTLASMSVKNLRQLASCVRVSLETCVEKSEILEALSNSPKLNVTKDQTHK